MGEYLKRITVKYTKAEAIFEMCLVGISHKTIKVLSVPLATVGDVVLLETPLPWHTTIFILVRKILQVVWLIELNNLRA